MEIANKRKIIFRYRLTDDTGCAPCVDNNLFTLACCKGGKYNDGQPLKCGLRNFIGVLWNTELEENLKVADKYDIYISGLYKDKLLFFAKVTNVIPMKEYYSCNKYSKRKDDIYFIDGNEFNKEFHYGNEEQYVRDKAGVYVIESNEFVYWGKEAQEHEELLRYFPSGRWERPTPKKQDFPKEVLTESNIAESEEMFECIKNIYGESALTEGTKGREPRTPIMLGSNCKGCG